MDFNFEKISVCLWYSAGKYFK